MKLLSRNEFRNLVFKRDNNKCVYCGSESKLDAHHIMERRLWTTEKEFGGYFLDNGASLCDDGTENSCHMKAEMTVLSTAQIREAAKIHIVLLPEQLYPDQEYDKWGNPTQSNGQRQRGPLFNDESVQKILKKGDVLKLFTKYIRYPRTYHMPYSPIVGIGDISNDRVHANDNSFLGKRVICTVKMDGSQATLYNDYMHGRTVDFKSNKTWTWLQNYHNSIKYMIDDGWRINVENLWGGCTQNIQYKNLLNFALAFMVWNPSNECLSWDDTVEYMNLFGMYTHLPLVDVIYDGIYDQEKILSLMEDKYMGDEMEGIVVRVARKFHYSEHSKCVGKLVRSNHQVRHGGELRLNRVIK